MDTHASSPSAEPAAAPSAGAWAAAAAAGEDMSLLEHALRLTPTQRLERHQHALELVQMLQRGKIRRDARPE